MTPDETKRVLGYMLAAWPNHKLDELGAIVWAEQLADVPADEATATAKSLVKQSRWFPNINEFREHWRRSYRADLQPFALPPSAVTPTDAALARIDQLRAELAAQKRPHPETRSA